jgi:hypothetical protein
VQQATEIKKDSESPAKPEALVKYDSESEGEGVEKADGDANKDQSEAGSAPEELSTHIPETTQVDNAPTSQQAPKLCHKWIKYGQCTFPHCKFKHGISGVAEPAGQRSSQRPPTLHDQVRRFDGFVLRLKDRVNNSV